MSDSEDEAAERQYKIVLVGEQQVGKTAIALRWIMQICRILELKTSKKSKAKYCNASQLDKVK